MSNSTNDQGLAVSPQLTDYVLGWQPGQSPPSRKFTLAQVAAAGGLPVTGGTISGKLTIIAGGLVALGSTGDISGAVITANGATSSGSTAGWTMVSTGTSAFSGPVAYGFRTTASNVLSSGFYAYSDIRVKVDIVEITPEQAFDWVTSARPVTYRKLARYDANPETAVPEAGFIAQDQIRAGYGHYVATADCPGMPERIDPDGFRSLPDVALNLNPQYQIAFLTRALQAVLMRLESQNTRIALLEAIINP